MGEKNMIEDTLFQIKNLEESLKKNAQGILSSTMRKEINSLVKESLMEQEEVVEPEMSPEDVATEDPAMMSDETGMEMDPSMVAAEPAFEDPEMMGDESLPGMETGDDETIDMRDASDAEVIRVFKAMGDNDGVVVTRDNNIITLTDDDDEYIIKLNESMENFGETAFDSELEEMYEDGTELNEFEYEEEDEDMDFGYEDEEDEDMGDEEDFEGQNDMLDYEDRAMGRMLDGMGDDWDSSFEDEHDYDDDFFSRDEDMEDGEEVEGIMYEIEMNDIEMMEMDDIDMMEMDDMEDVGVIHADITDIDIPEAQVYILFLTMMFIPVDKRQKLLDAIQDKVKVGGCVIIVDKICDHSGYFSTVMKRLTWHWKIQQGAEAEDIINKEISLAGVQIPMDNYFLDDAKEFFRMGEFAGWVIEF